MKTLIASAFVLAMLVPTVANAAITIGIGAHPMRIAHHHHRHQVCSFHHHHRVCSWR